jgi:phosphatidylserine/phosphatidylglycerophosphate/cardiolipin synthase-like enzyme
MAATVRGVYFSPNGGATEAVVREINEARSTIFVQAYSFTSAPIADALVKAHRRGVAVTVILDKSQRTEHYSAATFLAHAGIPTYIDAAHAIAHNKIILIDDAIIITGSFNFTKAAEEHNAENLLILYGTTLYPLYKENFDAHLAHSERYQ